MYRLLGDLGGFHRVSLHRAKAIRILPTTNTNRRTNPCRLATTSVSLANDKKIVRSAASILYQDYAYMDARNASIVF